VCRIAIAAGVSLWVGAIVYSVQTATREEDAPGAFHRHGEAICLRAQHRTNALTDPASLSELAAVSATASAISADARRALGRLAAPDELQPAIDRLLYRLAAQGGLIRRVAGAARSGRRTEVRKLVAAGQVQDRLVARAAQRVELQACVFQGR
jgi:hypothetical protein